MFVVSNWSENSSIIRVTNFEYKILAHFVALALCETKNTCYSFLIRKYFNTFETNQNGIACRKLTLVHRIYNLFHKISKLARANLDLTKQESNKRVVPNSFSGQVFGKSYHTFGES